LLVHIGGLGAESRLGFMDGEGNPVGDDLATPGLFQAPGIAPDGLYLAFSQAAGEQFQVAVQDMATGAQSTVRQLGLAAMNWSPAGGQLAFISPARRQLTFVGPLQVIDAATGEVRTLVNDSVIAFFWSPDGSRIATLTQNSGRNNPGAGVAPGLVALEPAAGQQAADVVLDL
ncbi:MAG: PD40 domain-containing protein, partial [Anaerolineae bacterium]|nr:PD40 domain-containing protein [Anaerolineae bacterium]